MASGVSIGNIPRTDVNDASPNFSGIDSLPDYGHEDINVDLTGSNLIAPLPPKVEELEAEIRKEQRKLRKQKRSEERRQFPEVYSVNLDPDLSFRIGRRINSLCVDFGQTARYQHGLARANNVTYLSNSNEDERAENGIVVIKPEQLEIVLITPEHAAQIIMSAFKHNKGSLLRPSQVDKKISSLESRYNDLMERNYKKQVYDLSSSLARLTLCSALDQLDEGEEPEELPEKNDSKDIIKVSHRSMDDAAALLSGKFGTEPQLDSTVGRNNSYSVTFTDEAQSFLKLEQMKSLKFILKTLKVSVSTELWNRITTRTPHVELIRNLALQEEANEDAEEELDSIKNPSSDGVQLPSYMVFEANPRLRRTTQYDGSQPHKT